MNNYTVDWSSQLRDKQSISQDALNMKWWKAATLTICPKVSNQKPSILDNQMLPSTLGNIRRNDDDKILKRKSISYCRNNHKDKNDYTYWMSLIMASHQKWVRFSLPPLINISYKSTIPDVVISSWQLYLAPSQGLSVCITQTLVQCEMEHRQPVPGYIMSEKYTVLKLYRKWFNYLAETSRS